MNSNNPLNYFLSFLLFLNLSCSETEEIEPIVENSDSIIAFEGVDKRLWEYFKRFEEEGLQRGIIIDIREEKITGEILEIEEKHVAGQCSFNNINPNHLTIDLTFWNSSNDKTKEFVIFHELGHCYLLRDHREDKNANGTCASLMRSGTSNCLDNYNSLTRETYIDELFDSNFAGDLIVNSGI